MYSAASQIKLAVRWPRTVRALARRLYTARTPFDRRSRTSRTPATTKSEQLDYVKSLYSLAGKSLK